MLQSNTSAAICATAGLADNKTGVDGPITSRRMPLDEKYPGRIYMLTTCSPAYR